jgi:hypothetical protein
MKIAPFALSLILTTTVLNNTVSAAIDKAGPLFWPENRLIPIKVSDTKANADALEFTITEFKNSTLPLFSSSMKEWHAVAGLTYYKTSAAFAHIHNPSIKTGISLVKSRDWLGDLNEDSLNRYVAALQISNPKRFTHLNPDTRFAPVGGSGFLVGNPYKMVHYEVVAEEDPTVVTEIREFIAQEKDLLIILSFESPKSMASRVSGTALMQLSALSRMDELE